MDGKTLAAYIGQTGTVTLNGLTVAVRVVNSQYAYGGLRLQIEPITGVGARWFEARNVTLGIAGN